MDLITLLNNLVASIDALKLQLADAQVAAQAQYDKGFADGVASVQPGFTQADIDAAVAAAVQPLNDSIAALQLQLEGVPAQVASAVNSAKAELKLALLEAYEAAQASESESEETVRKLLQV